ncbi:MAG: cobyric acid synthase [Bacteroidales bacterium]|nr:cobyric acid synthase [Bacteroidales bacterium]
MRLRPIMFAGTGSDVGKSIIAAGFCRIFKQDGYKPAPFKAQNMALNSFATPEGLEIGRAQATQAEAAGIECCTDMNPLLLKPSTDLNSQVILNGKSIGNQSAWQYFRKEGREFLREEVCKAFDRLSKRFNPIVMEGAGSIAEINLKSIDIVNMSMAEHANAKIILVADIDKGGVIASIYGTIMLLEEKERERIAGVIINKFRGDVRLFEDGKKIIEEKCGIPVLGIVPYFNNIFIEEEDSVILEKKNSIASSNKINIAVILLKHLSNFTDFQALEQDERINLFYTKDNKEIEKADIIIIPGTKNTISDLKFLRENGIAHTIIKSYKEGKTIIGICGGYQIMGNEVCDPNGIEGDDQFLPGLSLLPIKTIMNNDKCTRQVKFKFLDCKDECTGYEIHNGNSEIIDKQFFDNHKVSNFAIINGKELDGCFLNSRCMGTYIHGILDNKAFIDYLLSPFKERINNDVSFDYSKFKQEQYDKLALLLRNNIDIEKIYKIIGL